MDMDINNPVPPLSTAAQTPSSQDYPMAEEESLSNQHMISGVTSVTNLQQEVVTEMSILDAPIEQILNGSAGNTDPSSRQESQRSAEILESRQEDSIPERVTSPPDNTNLPTVDTLLASVNESSNDRRDAMEVAEPETAMPRDQNAPAQSLDNQPPTGMASQPRRPSSPPVTSPESISTAPPEARDSANPDDPEYSETSSDCESDDERPTREDFVEDTSTPDEEELKEIESQREIAGTDRECLLALPLPVNTDNQVRRVL